LANRRFWVFRDPFYDALPLQALQEDSSKQISPPFNALLETIASYYLMINISIKIDFNLFYLKDFLLKKKVPLAKYWHAQLPLLTHEQIIFFLKHCIERIALITELVYLTRKLPLRKTSLPES